MAKIAFIGLGTMGRPMAHNLLKRGHDLSVFDLSTAASASFESTSARLARSPADAASEADFVLTVLPTSADVNRVMLSADGAVNGMRPGAILIDSTTASPSESVALAKKLECRNIGMVDATLGRPPWDAEAGTLLFLVGGDLKHIDKARPILECMGNEIVVCGPQGSGAMVKTINNYMSVLGMVVAAETLAFGRKAGVDREILLRVLQSTVAGRGAINVLYPKKVLAGDLTPLFSMRLAQKDLGVALEFGGQIGMPLCVGAAGREVLSLGRAAGRIDQDVTALLLALEEITGATTPST